MDFLIRPAEGSDTGDMFDIRASVHENRLRLDDLSSHGLTPVFIRALIEAAPCAWMAIAEDRAVGFSMVDLEDATLFSLFVRPEYEGRGIGRALMAQAEDAMFRRHPQIGLETSAASRAARFYAGLGWQIAARLGDGNIRMTKTRPA
jgi:ribosomal protein S18 acetylase RimI-like enzyme